MTDEPVTTIDNMPRGFMCIIHTDGTTEFMPVQRNFAALEKLLGATTLDMVNIGKARRDDLIMAVDDHGYQTKTVDHGDGRIELVPMKALKPVNEIATALYHTLTGPGDTHKIVGDVAIVHDEDFADE